MLTWGSCRAGDGLLEDTERREDLGTSQLQEDAAKVAVSEPLHKTVKPLHKIEGRRNGSVHCPKDKTCELECNGNHACFRLKGGTGHFAKITCKGPFACRAAKLPDCPKDKTCRLECKGSYACVSLEGSTGGHFATITCDSGRIGKYACRMAKLPDCPAKAQCELLCSGMNACANLRNVPMGAAGSIVDIVNNGQGNTNNKITPHHLPKPSSLPPKMVAFRVSGVKGYSWPPEQCKAQAETVGKNWWFCPSARKCAKSERECRGAVHARWGSKLGTKQAHQMPTEPQQHTVGVNRRKGRRQVQGYFYGKQITQSVPIKVMEDASAGYQGLSCMQLGGLRTVAGTVVSVDASQDIFILPQGARPNYCIRSWAPLISKDESVVPVILEICKAGRAQVHLPPGVATSEATMSLSSIKFVPFEVSGGVQFQSVWKNAKGSHRYYHRLDMGSGTMCVLSGTISAIWGAADSQTIGQLDPECTKGYKEGFQIVASVKMRGKQVWEQSGAAASFQLFLRGKDHSELVIWTSLKGIAGTAVTVSLDGTTLASGLGLKQCLSSNILGDSSISETRQHRKKQTQKVIQKLKRKNKELKSKLSQARSENRADPNQLRWTSSHESGMPPSYADLGESESRVTVTSMGYLTRLEGEQKKCPKSDLRCPSSNAADSKPRDSDFDGCQLVRNQVNTSQPGFAPKSVLKPGNMVIMGADVTTRTCVLRGVVKFTSFDSTAIAFLDPNYRDPKTRMPFCLPMTTMIFLASVTDSNNSTQCNWGCYLGRYADLKKGFGSDNTKAAAHYKMHGKKEGRNCKCGERIARTVALQIEPHGRIVIIGNEPRDVSVRLDNIMYHPLMHFQFVPQSCAPYCFPAGREGSNGMVSAHA